MTNLIIAPTRNTPKICFDYSGGIFEIAGRSIPENSYEFFRPVLEWLDEYHKAPLKKTVLKVILEYTNTSSAKYYLDIFKKFEALYKEQNDVVIEWYYEDDDEDMLEVGEDYGSLLRVPFELKTLEQK